MDLETVWYESFPYVYGIGGVVLLVLSGHSILMKVAGVLLIIAAIAVLRARWNYRRATFYELPSAAEPEPSESLEPMEPRLEA